MSVAATSLQPIISPIVYQQTNPSLLDQKVRRCWLMRKVAELLRNAFLLPLYNRKIHSSYLLDQQAMARAVCEMREGRASDTQLKKVHEHFTIQDIEVHVETSIINLRVFESKKGSLRLILFAFNGNREIREGKSVRWDPLTMKDLSGTILSVLKALREHCIDCDSLITTSLGNVTLDGLKHLSWDQEVIPRVIISNRGLPSLRKAVETYPFPLNHLLYGVVRLAGLDANPEQELLNFLIRHKKPQRTIVMIEAVEDHYFSKGSGFHKDFHESARRAGALVARLQFYPFRLHTRAHHAAPLHCLKRDSIFAEASDPKIFSFENAKNMAVAIAQNVFSKKHKPHTCFYVGGNDVDLNGGTVREVAPLLAAHSDIDGQTC